MERLPADRRSCPPATARRFPRLRWWAWVALGTSALPNAFADELPGALAAAPAAPSVGFATQAAQGADAYGAGRFSEALAAFDAALTQPAPAAARAKVEYNAAACLFELGRYAEAERRFLVAAHLAPELTDLATLDAGVAALRSGRPEVARRYLASVSPADEESSSRAAELTAELEASGVPASSSRRARPASGGPRGFPAPGWSGWALVSGGFDSNAAQSGVAADTGAGASATQSSPFISTLAALDYTLGLTPHTRAQFGYAGDWLGLVAAPAQDLSQQAHSVGLRLYRVDGLGWLVRFEVAGGVTLAGLDAVELVSREGWVTARLQRVGRAPWLTRLDLEFKLAQATSEWEYLSGVTSTVMLSERAASERLDAGVGAGVRYAGLGSYDFDVTVEAFPACSAASTPGPGGNPGAVDSRCLGAVYFVPVAHIGPFATADVAVPASERVTLGVNLRAEYRRYLHASLISTIPESRKVREDVRLRTEADVEVALDPEGHASLVLDYGLLVSGSNVAYALRDPGHQWDYDDRRFVQHVVELGLLGAF